MLASAVCLCLVIRLAPLQLAACFTSCSGECCSITSTEVRLRCHSGCASVCMHYFVFLALAARSLRLALRTVLFTLLNTGSSRSLFLENCFSWRCLGTEMGTLHAEQELPPQSHRKLVTQPRQHSHCNRSCYRQGVCGRHLS